MKAIKQIENTDHQPLIQKNFYSCTQIFQSKYEC